MNENGEGKPGDGGFLSRWSRRKRQAAEEEAIQAEAEASAADVENRQAEEQKESDEDKANREAAEAVDIEKLTFDSDFSLFMKSGVPELIRRKAMRKLWSTNPVLANLDGLNDYEDDYSDPKLNVFKSAWTAAHGYLKEEAEAAEITGTGEAGETVGPADKQPAADAGSDEVKKIPEDRDPATTGVPEAQAREAEPETEAEIADAPKRVSLRRRLNG